MPPTPSCGCMARILTALEVSMRLNLAFNKPLVFSFGTEKESEFSILTPFKTEQNTRAKRRLLNRHTCYLLGSEY